MARITIGAIMPIIVRTVAGHTAAGITIIMADRAIVLQVDDPEQATVEPSTPGMTVIGAKVAMLKIATMSVVHRRHAAKIVDDPSAAITMSQASSVGHYI